MAKIEKNSLFTAVSEEESSTVSGGDGQITRNGVTFYIDSSNNIVGILQPDGSVLAVTTSSTPITTDATSGTGLGTKPNQSAPSLTPGVPGTGLLLS